MGAFLVIQEKGRQNWNHNVTFGIHEGGDGFSSVCHRLTAPHKGSPESTTHHPYKPVFKRKDWLWVWVNPWVHLPTPRKQKNTENHIMRMTLAKFRQWETLQTKQPNLDIEEISKLQGEKYKRHRNFLRERRLYRHKLMPIVRRYLNFHSNNVRKNMDMLHIYLLCFLHIAWINNLCT